MIPCHDKWLFQQVLRVEGRRKKGVHIVVVFGIHWLPGVVDYQVVFLRFRMMNCVLYGRRVREVMTDVAPLDLLVLLKGSSLQQLRFLPGTLS